MFLCRSVSAGTALVAAETAAAEDLDEGHGAVACFLRKGHGFSDPNPQPKSFFLKLVKLLLPKP